MSCFAVVEHLEGHRVNELQGCRKHLESGEALKPHPATPIATPHLVTVSKCYDYSSALLEKVSFFCCLA